MFKLPSNTWREVNSWRNHFGFHAPEYHPRRHLIEQAPYGQCFLKSQLEAERARLTKELHEAEVDIAQREARLSNTSFVDKVPAHVVQRERDGLAVAQSVVEKLRERLAMC